MTAPLVKRTRPLSAANQIELLLSRVFGRYSVGVGSRVDCRVEWRHCWSWHYAPLDKHRTAQLPTLCAVLARQGMQSHPCWITVASERTPGHSGDATPLRRSITRSLQSLRLTRQSPSRAPDQPEPSPFYHYRQTRTPGPSYPMQGRGGDLPPTKTQSPKRGPRPELRDHQRSKPPAI